MVIVQFASYASLPEDTNTKPHPKFELSVCLTGAHLSNVALMESNT